MLELDNGTTERVGSPALDKDNNIVFGADVRRSFSIKPTSHGCSARDRIRKKLVLCLRDREVACSASDRQGSNFESCVWRTVSSQSSHHPQEVLLAQFSLYVHKGGLKPDSFHLHKEKRDILCFFFPDAITRTTTM